jgi:hypothetical protein
MGDSFAVPRVVPALLSVLAGYLDSCMFLALFGLFVAHVTSSFVLVGSQLIAAESGRWVKLLAIPVFLLACAVTTLMVGSDPRRRRPALAAVLWLETALLAGLFIAVEAHDGQRKIGEGTHRRGTVNLEPFAKRYGNGRLYAPMLEKGLASIEEYAAFIKAQDALFDKRD